MYKQLTILATSVALLGSFAAFAVAKDLDVQAAEDKLRTTLEKVEPKANPNVGDKRQQVDIPNIKGIQHRVPEMNVQGYGTDLDAPVDPRQVAQAFKDKNKLFDVNAAEKADLLVFVSFSMPDASLKRIALETKKTGAAMVLRGFKNDSLKETMKAVEEITALGGQVLIHPDLFTHYNVVEVPTYALARKTANAGTSCEDGFCSEHYALKGDASMEFMLEQFSQFKTSPELTQYAETKLAQLRGYK